MLLRSFLFATPLLATLVLSAGCSKPRIIQQGDPHLQEALKLIADAPDKALAELALATTAKPPEISYVRGLVFEKKGDNDKALAAYARAIELDPDALRALSSLARVQLAQGKIKEGRKNLQLFLEKAPDDLRSVFLFLISSSNPQEQDEALILLRAWPDKRPQPPKNVDQLPLKAEYFLALTAFETDEAKRERARTNARRAEFGSVSIAYQLAQYSLKLNQLKFAQVLLAKLSTAELQLDQLEQVARWSLALGDSETASKALSRIPGNRRTLELLELRGRLELAQHHPQRALSHLEATRKLVKKVDIKRLDRIEILIAEAFAHLDKSDEAIIILKSILKRSVQNKSAALLLSRIDFKGGNRKPALTRMQAWTKRNPKDAELTKTLAQMQFEMDDFQNAEKSYRKLRQLQPDNPPIIKSLAQCLQAQENAEGALDELSKGVVAFPEDMQLLRALATQLLRMEKPDDALLVLKNSKAENTKPVEVALLLADTYATLQRPQEARTTLEALVKLMPTSGRSWSALARMQNRDEDWKGMEISLRKSLELNPRAMKDKARLATLLSKQGKDAEAVQLYTQLANATGKDPIALNNAAMLYVDELDNAKRAVTFAEKAFKLAPQSAAMKDTLGWSLAKRGSKEDLKRAEKLLAQAHAKLATGESAYHYAYALIQMGRIAQGKALLNEALNIPGSEKWRAPAQKLLK